MSGAESTCNRSFSASYSNNYRSTGYESQTQNWSLYAKQYFFAFYITVNIGYIRCNWILCTVIAKRVRSGQLACNNINSYSWWIFHDNEMYYP